MLSGKNKANEIEMELINDTQIDECAQKLSKGNDVYLIHDPCDIRKPHSKTTENLGKVRSLDSKVINGFSSYNIVAITPQDKSVHLFSHESYSNRDQRFLKAEELKNLEANKDFTNKAEAQKKYNTNDWFTKTTLAKKFITKASDCFKKANPEVRLTHILDREFDTKDYFKHVDMLGDQFVIVPMHLTPQTSLFSRSLH